MWGTDSRPIAEDAATETVCMSAAEVLRGQGIEGFISEKKDFVSNAGLEQEVVEISEGGDDMFPELSAL